MNNATFSDRLKELRLSMGYSQQEFGNILGVTKQVVSRYEKGLRSPKISIAAEYAQKLKVDLAWLLGGTNTTDSVQPSDNDPAPDNIIPLPKMNQVPLLGTIACGHPILAQENIDEQIDLPEHIRADFALRCKGDSMINARIFDGDIVYIRHQPTVLDGQIAAVLIDGEATLKRVRLFDDHIVLEPENPQYRPLSFWGPDMNTPQILGLAVAFTSTVK